MCWDTESQSDFLHALDTLRQTYEIPGVAVALVQQGQVVCCRGLGLRNLRKQTPVTPQTLFHIASVQKSMTAMLAAIWVDDGLLSWDTSLAQVLPHYPWKKKVQIEAITLRHLLSMTAGIPESLDDRMDEEGQHTDDLLRLLNRCSLFPVGQRFVYSNCSYALAGYMGIWAKQPHCTNLPKEYAKVVQERIFQPLGILGATSSVLQARSQPDHALSYERKRKKLRLLPTEDRDYDPQAPSGCFKMSVCDLALYLATQMRGGVIPNGQRIVSETQLRETWRLSANQQTGEDYAMGWNLSTTSDISLLSHEGGYDGFASLLAMLPSQQQGLALLANLEDPEDTFLDDALALWLRILHPS